MSGDVWGLCNRWPQKPYRFVLIFKSWGYELHDLLSASMIPLKRDLSEGEIQMLKEYCEGAQLAAPVVEFISRTRLLKAPDQTWQGLSSDILFQSTDMGRQYRSWQNLLLYRYVLGGNRSTNVEELWKFFISSFHNARFNGANGKHLGHFYFPIKPSFGYVPQKEGPSKRFGEWVENFYLECGPQDVQACLEEFQGFTENRLPWSYQLTGQGHVFTLNMEIEMPSPASPDMIPIFSQGRW
jgi:hypothetical protein